MSERAEPGSDGEAGGDAATQVDADDRRGPDELPPEIREAVPEYDDEYLDRVSDRLLYSYDLDADVRVRGERFELSAEMRMRNQKQFVHPALNYADHESAEHLFARRTESPTVADFERLVEFAHEVADERVEGHEEHYGTDVTVVLVVDRIPDAVAEFVSGFRDRTLLKFGYYGHYEVNLIAVAPDAEELVASEAADIAGAFALWEDVERDDVGFFSRLARRFWT